MHRGIARVSRRNGPAGQDDKGHRRHDRPAGKADEAGDGVIRREEIIGGQRLILGDCREVLPLIGRVDAVVTDPPYEAQAHTAVRRTRRSNKTGESAALSFAAIAEDMRDFVPEWAAKNCNGWMLAFCQVEAVSDWRYAMEGAGLKYKRGMAWVKPDSSPQFNGQMPAQGFECIAAAWCGFGISRWNGGGRRGVFTHMTSNTERSGLHPTEKPIALMVELVELFTTPGGVIVDPFCGSGTTLVACQRLGRNGIGIELDEGYFDAACRRVEAAARQPDLLIPPPKPPTQEVLL